MTVPFSPALDRVERGRLCAGCGGCVAVAPGKVAMAYSTEGLLRPVQAAPLSAVEDAAVAAICPGLGITQDAAGRPDHVLWGPVLELATGHATDADLRHRASSGGALSALLVHLLDSGAVTRIVQIAADPEIPYANRTVVGRTAAEVAAAAGSRYAPSAPLADLPALLADGEGPAAFVGKPCDIAALRALARRDPRIDRAFPWMISFFCAGVPALSGARGILAALDVAEDDVAAFRYRGHGWPGRATVVRRDGTEKSMTYAQSWGEILTRKVQFRCRICPDGTGGLADIVCADAWHCDAEGYPLFEEEPGRSLIVARTAKGAALLAAARAAGRLETRPERAEAVIAMQPGQRQRKELAASRILALRLLGRPAPRFTGFNLAAAARRAGLVANLRSFLGTCARILGLR